MLFEAFEAQQGGRSEEARQLFARVAQGGDMRGAYHLGRSLADSASDRPDYSAAVRWFRWGAEHGHAGCARELGLSYELGRGVRADPAQAMRWYRQASDGGDGAAMRFIGQMVLRGEVVVRDANAGRRWLEAASDRKDVEAALILAGMYERGEDVPANPTRAAQWYWAAADPGRVQLDRAVEDGMRRLLPALNNLARRGDAAAQYYLARVQTDEIDERRSLALMQSAARQGHPEACYGMAKFYRDGMRGLPQDMEASFRWCHASAEAGWWPAQHDLAFMYARGYGVGRDLEEAWRWYRQASEQGDTQSMHDLWVMCEGRTRQEREEAMGWLQLAAERGNADAMASLGAALLEGDCVPNDLVQAARWFMASVQAGGGGDKELAELAGHLTPDQLGEADRLADGDGSLARELIEQSGRGQAGQPATRAGFRAPTRR